MEYVYGTAVVDGVTRENLKVVGGVPMQAGEYLTTVREYDDCTITDRCRIVKNYHSDTDAEGIHYDWYIVDSHYRYVEKFTPQVAEALTDAVTGVEDAMCEVDAATEERLVAVETALCELDEMMNGGTTNE